LSILTSIIAGEGCCALAVIIAVENRMAIAAKLAAHTLFLIIFIPFLFL